MPEPADLDFLDEMKLQATLHAESLHSKDHWAKPFYSDVHLFKPGVRRVFIGVNSKGDKCSHKFDQKQENEQRVWSGNKPLHNAYMDECWGNCNKSPAPKGRSHLQIAAQEVFKGMYGPKWKRRLRNTPCFNLIPVSSDGIQDEKLGNAGVEWSVELIEYLRPHLIILYGNGLTPKKGRSVWFALEKKFCLKRDPKSTVDITTTYKIHEGTIRRKPLKGVRVLGLPHLSYMKGDLLKTLSDRLSEAN